MRSTHGFVWTLSTLTPRAYVPRHDHARAGLTYVVAGSLREGFTTRTFDAPTRTVIAKSPDAAHWDHAGSKGATCLILAPEHPLVEQLTVWNKNSARQFVAECEAHATKTFKRERRDLAVELKREDPNEAMSTAASTAAWQATLAATVHVPDVAERMWQAERLALLLGLESA